MNKKIFLLYSFFTFILFAGAFSMSAQSAITFECHGRFGDQLFTYCKAKWLAHVYNLTFLCPDFSFKNTLQLDKLELNYTKNMNSSFSQVKRIKNESEIIPEQSGTLYIMDFFIKIKNKRPISDPDAYMWQNAVTNINKNQDFLAHLRERISPKGSITHVDLPTNMPTIAVHVRRGGGYDNYHFACKRWPTKFPPDKFYIDQIKGMANLFEPDQSIYVHIFTDDKDPKKLVEAYKAALALPNLIFGYRDNNNYKAHVLDDLFAMTEFDYLIRSTSYYSLISMILGNHKLCIFPKDASSHAGNLTIDSMWVVAHHEDGSMDIKAIKSPG